MSAESAILLRLDALTVEVRALRCELAARPARPWPERMTTQEAVMYVRQAYGRPRFAAATLRLWRAQGRLTRYSPCRWDRGEIDGILAGAPVEFEARGRRRAS
jgi:hypothetical protein